MAGSADTAAMRACRVTAAAVTGASGYRGVAEFGLHRVSALECEHEASDEPLVGVRALMIYPLNALIASQRERLVERPSM